MGEDVRMSEYGYGGDEDKVVEWEIGLPNGDDLTPLSHALVPSILALAFSITPERNRTIQDVNRASWTTISSLRSIGSSGTGIASSSHTAVAVDRVGSSSPESEEGDSESEDLSGKTSLKRPRLVWTPQLHKRFVEVVAHLGIKNAVPKTIMQLMNVQGLSRENVASHLQKYRLYLKRLHGLTTEDPSSFQKGGNGNGELGIPIPAPMPMPMPIYRQNMGMEGYNNNNHGHNQNHYHKYHHNGNGVFESNQYLMQQSKFGSMANSPSFGNGGVNDK